MWIRGPVVCQGYWKRAELTEETFGARLSDGEGPYLRSGDMAFLHNGELVLCGRRKEMIIVRGRNFYPHDIESAGERAHPALRGAPAAAFSVDRDAGEELVLVQSVPDTDALPIPLPELARRIRSAVTAEHEVDVHHLVLVSPAQIPKTISGKIQRGECRRRYLADELETLLEPLQVGPPSASASVPDRRANRRPAGGSAALPGLLAALDPSLRAGVISAELRRRLGDVFDVPADEVPTAVPLVAQGLESIRAMELRAMLERDLQVDLPLATFLRSSVEELTELMVHRLDARQASSESETFHADPEHRFEPFRLTGLQQAYLVGRHAGDERGDVATHLYLEIEAGDLDLRRLKTALTALVSRHDMLRAVVAEDGTQWVLPEADATPVPFSVTDCSAESGARTAAAVREEMSHEIRPIGQWPMWEVRALILPGDRIRLAISIDLLIADVASIRLFFDDWRRLYAGERLPPLRTTFRDCVNAHAVDPEDPEYVAARDYWLRRVPELPEGPRLPWRRGATAPARWSRRAHRLPARSWSRIRQLARQHELTPTSVLLAAFATVLGRVVAGRRPIPAEPAGWFSRRPVRFRTSMLVTSATATLGRHPAIARAVTTATGTRYHPHLTTFVVPDRVRRPAPAEEAGGEGAEYESLLGAVITDAADRAAVTAAQRGRRADLTSPAVGLPDFHDPERTDRRWNRRRSHRRFAATEVPLAELARLLHCLRAVGAEHRPVPKYRYGSAGSLYPVRTYVYVRPGRVDGLPGGSYYYDPMTHRLCTLGSGVELPASVHLSMNQDAFSSAAFHLFLVGPMAEVEPMYGRRAHDFCLIEAGAMSQLLAESATEGPLGLCQIGLLRDEQPLRALFSLGEDEVLLHGLLGGVALPEPGEAMGVGVGVPSARGAGPAGLAGQVRELAVNALPAHMVPSRIRVIDELPLTDQGKVDRRRLEELAGEPETGVEAVEPGSDTEARVAAIVAETLGLDRAGVTENLFGLGADSVQLIAIRQRLSTAFGHELPLVRLFENASIRTVAAALEAAPRVPPH
ncbi:2-succinylbenzoate--CoA ligase [Streptomyces narbonensis]